MRLLMNAESDFIIFVLIVHRQGRRTFEDVHQQFLNEDEVK
jgi:hypothetical protein